MKLNNIFKIIALMMVGSMMLLFSSCLKNDSYYIDLSKGAPSIELPLAAVHSNSPFALALTTADTPSTYYVYVNVASVNPLSTPVTAKLSVDSAYLTSYNANNGTSFELLPDSTYTVDKMDLTVPAGQRLAYSTVKIYTAKIQSGHQYVLPFSIASASVAINNWSHLLINVTAKSVWAGNYSLHVNISGNNAYSGTDFTDNPVTLSTVGPNIVSEGDIADFFGGYSEYTFNSDGTISAGAYSSLGGGSYGAQVVASSYDASTHDFHIKYTILSGKYVFDLTYTRD